MAHHPVVDKALGLVLDEKTQRIALTAAAADELRAELRARFGSKDLAPAAAGLLDLAYFLQLEMKSAAVALALVDVVRTAVEPLTALGAAEADLVTAISAGLSPEAERFKKFAASTSSNTVSAPETPSAGAVRNNPLARFSLRTDVDKK